MAGEGDAPLAIHFTWADATEQPAPEPKAINGDAEAAGFILEFAGDNTC